MKCGLVLAVIAFCFVREGKAAECDIRSMNDDLRFLKQDHDANACMYNRILRHGLSGWRAFQECNAHANWVNLENNCYPHPVCGELRKEGWTPACPGEPRVKKLRKQR